LVNDNEIEVIAGSQDFFISVQSENDCGVSNYITLTVDVPADNNSPANFNGDCVANDTDMLLLLEAFGCLDDCGEFDLTGDGIVGVNDLLLFIEIAAH